MRSGLSAHSDVTNSPLTLLGICWPPEFIFPARKEGQGDRSSPEKIEKENWRIRATNRPEEVLERADKAGIAPQPRKP